MANNFCEHCDIEIDEFQQVSLHPCNHVLCVHCMIDRLAQQSNPFTCPSCDGIVASHSYKRQKVDGKERRTRSSSKRTAQIIEVEHTYEHNIRADSEPPLIDGVDDFRILFFLMVRMGKDSPEALME